MDIQLRKEIRTNDRSQSGGHTTIWHCANYGEPGYNTCICKKDEEMFNIYSSK